MSKQVIEEAFGLGNITDKLKNLFRSKETQINRDLANILAEYFNGQFARFMENRLKKASKRVSLIRMVTAYVYGDDSERKKQYENVFEVIGLPMIEFFLLKTFGRVSNRQMIKQRTPFIKKVSTGNRELDKIIFNTLLESVNNPNIRKSFKTKMQDNINKMFDDLEYEGGKLEKMSSYFKDKYNIDIEDSSIDFDEIFDHKIRRGKTLLEFKKLFGLKTKQKFLKTINKLLPKLKKRIRRKIQDEVFQLEYGEIKQIAETKDMGKIAEIALNPIMENIFRSANKLYFKDENLNEVAQVVQDVFTNKSVVQGLKTELSKFFQEKLKSKKSK